MVSAASRRAALALALAGLSVLSSGCTALLTTWVPGLASLPGVGCSWERDPARCLQQDFPGYTGALGVSDPMGSEREADAQARADAVQKLVSQILGVDVAAELEIVQTEQAAAGGPEYRAQVRLRGRYAVSGGLPGFELLRRSAERDRQGRYTVRALVGVRDADRVRRAFWAELVSGVGAAQAQVEGYVRGGEFPPPAFTEAVEAFRQYLEAAERFQARHGGAGGTLYGLSRDLALDRAFLAEAKRAFDRHYESYLQGLAERDAYGEAVATALQLYQVTRDTRWQSRAEALVGEMVRRARELWGQQALDAALEVLTLPEGVRRHLSETQPGRFAEIVGLSLRIEQAREQERRRPPRPPAALTAQVTEEGIRLAWQPAEARPVAGYRIYRAQAAIDARVEGLAQAAFRLLAEIPGGETTYRDLSAAPGQAYVYRVAAVNEAGVVGPPSETTVVRLYHPALAPANLRVQRGGDGGYLVAWSYPYPAELAAYRIRVAAAGEEAQEPAEVSVPFYRLGSLAVDQLYEVGVAAVRRDGQVGPWASVSFWTPPAPPQAVHVEQSPQGLILRWQSQSRQKLAAVRLYEAGSGERPVGERSLAELAENRWLLTEFSVGQTYRFFLTHVSAEGLESAPSPVVAITPHSYPPALAGLRVSALGPSAVVLSWQPSPVPDLAAYRVERRAEGEAQWVALAQARSTVHVDSGLADDTRYTYRVVAVNTAGVESPPATVQWLSRPRPVGDLRFERAGERSVLLRWSDPNRHPVRGYRVYREEPGGGEREVGATAEAGLAEEGLRYGTEYRYRVVAFRDSLASEPSAWLSVRIFSRPAPVSGLAAQVLPDGAVRLSWQAGPEEDLQGYRVDRREVGEATWATRGTTPAPAFLDRADDGRRYRYRVIPYNAAQEGEPAEVEVVSRPLPPVDVQAQPAPGGVRIRWSDPNPVAPGGYRVYRALAGTAPGRLQLVAETASREVLDESPTLPGFTYVYHVRAVSVEGVESAPSAPAMYRAP